MSPQKTVPKKEVPSVSLGILLSGEDAPVDVKKPDLQKIAQAVAEVPHEKLPRGVKRVKLNAFTEGRKNLIHDDQKFTASCSYKGDGSYEAPWVLAVCHNQNDGWFVRAIGNR